LIQSFVAVFAVAVAWGSAKSKADALHEKLEQSDNRLDQIEADIKASNDRFVTRQEFISALLDIKDQLKETRMDIKRVIELISKRVK